MVGFLLLGIWIFISVLAASIARNKGRSFGWWYFWGAIGGLIALVIIMALPESPDELAQN